MVRFFIIILPILVNVAFITLLERKILGFSQLRLGPNKVSIRGLLQPFRDAIKLFVKQSSYNYNVNWKLYLRGPRAILVLALILWRLLPLNNSATKWPIIIISLLVVLRLGVYPLLLRGWSRNRKYRIIGAIRGVAQTIRYEISLALLTIQFLLVLISCNVKDQYIFDFWVIFRLPLLRVIWLVILLAETNRTPFDFAEGESELVSGFNVEYASIGFVLIFLREYAIILLFASARVIFFTNIKLYNVVAALVVIVIARVWIILRATLPRYRYDLLINVAWKSYLPLTLGIIRLARLIYLY